MSSNSFTYHSMQAANYRTQGLDADAERNEHFMRCDLARMYDNDAAKDYMEQSRRYSEAKAQGLEENAAMYKRGMDAALIRMTEG